MRTVVRKHGWRKDSVDHYREDWFSGNRKEAIAQWENGPLPYGSLLWPRYYSEIRRDGAGWFRFENCADLVFEYLLDGSLTYTQNGVTETVRPGEIYVMHPGGDIVFHAETGDCFHRHRLMICGTLAQELDLELHLYGCNVFQLADSGPFIGRLCGIAERMAAHRPEEAAELSAMVYSLITGFASEHSRSRVETVPEPLKRVLQEMRKGPGDCGGARHGSAYADAAVSSASGCFSSGIPQPPPSGKCRTACRSFGAVHERDCGTARLPEPALFFDGIPPGVRSFSI